MVDQHDEEPKTPLAETIVQSLRDRIIEFEDKKTWNQMKYPP